MSKQNGVEPGDKVPLGQVFLDDIFLLLALGLGVPLIFYIVWGIWDLAQVQPFVP
jgi:hypothetical protein